jgi:hypothetical protein
MNSSLTLPHPSCTARFLTAPWLLGAVTLRQAAAAGMADNGNPIRSEVVDFIRYNGMTHFPEFVASMGCTYKLQGLQEGQCDLVPEVQGLPVFQEGQ